MQRNRTEKHDRNRECKHCHVCSEGEGDCRFIKKYDEMGMLLLNAGVMKKRWRHAEALAEC